MIGVFLHNRVRVPPIFGLCAAGLLLCALGGAPYAYGGQ
jgi:hypothetical protein